MGVLSCNRSGCDDIMCDRMSHEFGYICDSCFEELLKTTFNCPDGIRTFMNSDKGLYYIMGDEARIDYPEDEFAVR